MSAHSAEKCPAGYECAECHEVTCLPCDIGQPDCPHARDLCAECRPRCIECRADAAEDRSVA